MILSRYLMREMTRTVLFIMAVLLLALLSQQIVRYLNYVATGKIPLRLLLTLVSFEIPYLVALLLPLGLYLGMLLALSRTRGNEMTVMALSGYTKLNLFRIILAISLGLSAFVLLLMLWVNPFISSKRQQLLEGDGASWHLIQTLMPGRFQISSDGKKVMYAENLSRDHQYAENIFMANRSSVSEKSRAWTLIRAKQGQQVWDPHLHELFFVTNNGFRYDGTPGQNDYKMTQFTKYAMRVPQQKSAMTHFGDETLSTTTLWRDYSDSKHAAELQWRISIGLSTLLLGIFAMPLTFKRSNDHYYFMLLPGILIYIVYINLLFIARHWVEQGTVSTMLGMWWVHALLFSFWALYFLWRTKPWMR